MCRNYFGVPDPRTAADKLFYAYPRVQARTPAVRKAAMMPFMPRLGNGLLRGKLVELTGEWTCGEAAALLGVPYERVRHCVAINLSIFEFVCKRTDDETGITQNVWRVKV